MAREKAERDKIAEKRRKVIIVLFVGRTTHQIGQCYQVYSKRVFSMEGGRRRKEEKEKEMIIFIHYNTHDQSYTLYEITASFCYDLSYCLCLSFQIEKQILGC